MLDNLFWVFFLVTCRSEWARGETLVKFVLAACRPQFSDFKPLKDGEMLDNFFLGAFLSLSVPKWTFPTANSIEFGAGSVHFGVWFR